MHTYKCASKFEIINKSGFSNQIFKIVKDCTFKTLKTNATRLLFEKVAEVKIELYFDKRLTKSR